MPSKVIERKIHQIQSRVSTYNRVVVSSGAPSITVGRTEELMEPPGGTHTTTDLYSKLSADPTIFAKLRIKSEKADA